MADVALWLSIGALVVGLVLILLEIVNPGFFMAVPGTVLVAMGIIGLVIPGVFGKAAAITIPAVGIPATIVTIWAYKKWAPPGDKPMTLSQDSLPGLSGRVEDPIPAEGHGYVRVGGQRWRATALRDIPAGDKITVIQVEGLTLTVE